MVLVVAILAVLAALGFSWAGTAIKGIQIQLAARSLFSAVVQTRNEAVVRNMRVVLCKSPTGQTCSLAGGWEQGWIIFGDTNNNASRDGTETIFFVQKRLSGSVGITGKAPVSNYVSYTGTGSSKYPSGGFQSGTITLCDKSDGAVQPRTIVITSTGKPHTEKATAADCI
jgi:type IV fimbrial biogenesis protein FimT